MNGSLQKDLIIPWTEAGMQRGSVKIATERRILLKNAENAGEIP